MKKTFFLIPIILIIISCSKELNDVSSDDNLTVEAKINEGDYAEIFLTNALTFNSKIDSLAILNSIESKAKVTLSDGETSEVLSLKRNDSRFPFVFYGSNRIKGSIEKNYKLSISIRDKEFTSNTSIPSKPSILSAEIIETDDEKEITEKFLSIKLTIDNTENTTRYFKILIKNTKETNFKSAEPFIFNSETLSSNDSFPLFVSYPKKINGEVKNQIKKGASFELSLVSITREQFDFWKAIKGDQTNTIEENSFSINIPSNISNDAFGYWSGENTTTIRVDIP